MVYRDRINLDKGVDSLSILLTLWLFCAIIGTMSKENVFQIPSYERQPAYNFDATKNSYEIYMELNAIAEEIEQCRLKNS